MWSSGMDRLQECQECEHEMSALGIDASDREQMVGWEAITASQHYANEHPRIQAVANLVDRLQEYRAELDRMADALCAVNSPERYKFYDEIYHIDALLYYVPMTITRIRAETLNEYLAAEHDKMERIVDLEPLERN